MAERVTVQDIADALGVSRNTVSKAINNTGVLAETTRERILQKAADMGYKQFSYLNITSSKPEPAAAKGEIALFSTGFIGNSHFASTMLDKFQREISLLGYSLTMYRISQDELEHLRLPGAYSKERTAGSICLEMFDRKYAAMLCEMDVPILFVDSPVVGCGDPLHADCLYMENQTNIVAFVKEMVRRKKKKIGFIGDYMHCQSFFERYMAYRNALYLFHLPCPDSYCVTGNKPGIKNPSTEDYIEYLADCFQKMDDMPEVLICANDFVALDTLQGLKKAGLSVPEDIWLCGFDDSPESKIVTPALTTIHIHSQIMGVFAVNLLMSRIKQPSLNFRTMYAETDLIYRKSTGD